MIGEELALEEKFVQQSGGTARGHMVYVGVGLVFALLLASYLVYQIAVVVLVLLLTLLFSVIISGPVDYLERRGVGRWWGTLAVLCGLIFVLGIMGAALVPAIENQAREFTETFPELLKSAEAIAVSVQNSLGLETSFRLDPQNALDSARNFLSGGALATVANVGASVVSVLSFALVIVIATIYAVAQPRPLINGFVDFFPAGQRQRVREILGDMYWTVQRWFLGQLTSMTIIGVLSTMALSLIGIPFALLLGIFSGLVSFIPFLGPTISVILPVLLALIGDPIDALWVVLAYSLIQMIETYLIYPLVMSQAVSLHPAVVMFALLIMGTLFGFVGVLLAVPLVTALQVLLRELWIERMDTLGTDPNPPVEAPKPKQRGRRLRRAARDLFRF